MSCLFAPQCAIPLSANTSFDSSYSRQRGFGSFRLFIQECVHYDRLGICTMFLASHHKTSETSQLVESSQCGTYQRLRVCRAKQKWKMFLEWARREGGTLSCVVVNTDFRLSLSLSLSFLLCVSRLVLNPSIFSLFAVGGGARGRQE